MGKNMQYPFSQAVLGEPLARFAGQLEFVTSVNVSQTGCFCQDSFPEPILTPFSCLDRARLFVPKFL